MVTTELLLTILLLTVLLGSTVLLLATETTSELGAESTVSHLLASEAAGDEAQVHGLKKTVIVNVGSLASSSAGLILLGGCSVVVGHGLVLRVLNFLTFSGCKSAIDSVRDGLVLSILINGLNDGDGVDCHFGFGFGLLRVEGSAVGVNGHNGQSCE